MNQEETHTQTHQNDSLNRWSWAYESSVWPDLLHISLAASDPYVVVFASG